MGAVIAPLTLLGGPLMMRAAWYTAGIVGGLSTVAMCAPSEKFLNMGGPLAVGFGVVFASSIGQYDAVSPHKPWISGALQTVLNATSFGAFRQKIVLYFKTMQRVVLAWACCFRYKWGDKIWSRMASLSNRSMKMKTHQTPKHCTACYLAISLRDFTLLESYHCDNHLPSRRSQGRNTPLTLQSNLPGLYTLLYRMLKDYSEVWNTKY